MKQWTIGDVAQRVGVATSTIRYYEEIGLLPEAERVNGRRRYDKAIVAKLNVIGLAKEAGFTLDEIQTLVHEFPEGTPPSARWAAMAEDKLQELEERVRRIEAMKRILRRTLDCECLTLEECGLELAKHDGAKEAI